MIERARTKAHENLDSSRMTASGMLDYLADANDNINSGISDANRDVEGDEVMDDVSLRNYIQSALLNQPKSY